MNKQTMTEVKIDEQRFLGLVESEKETELNIQKVVEYIFMEALEKAELTKDAIEKYVDDKLAIVGITIYGKAVRFHTTMHGSFFFTGLNYNSVWLDHLTELFKLKTSHHQSINQ